MSTKSSNTPRTDAFSTGCEHHEICDDFARTLERELNAARAELAALRAELGKLSDPVAVHINMLRGTIATPSRELMEHVWAEPQPVPLDRPDRPGWWWFRLEKRHPWTAMEARMCDGELCVDEGCDDFNPAKNYHVGEWLPATPPAPPNDEEGEG